MQRLPEANLELPRPVQQMRTGDLWALRRTGRFDPRHVQSDRLGTQHMTGVLCPVCGGSVALIGGRSDREGGHAFGSDQWQQELGQEAFVALLAAVRALEDWIVGAKWLLTQPLPSPHLRLQVEQAQRQADILRELIEARREAPAPEDTQR